MNFDLKINPLCCFWIKCVINHIYGQIRLDLTDFFVCLLELRERLGEIVKFPGAA